MTTLPNGSRDLFFKPTLVAATGSGIVVVSDVHP
jgi:hypothetical protein